MNTDVTIVYGYGIDRLTLNKISTTQLLAFLREHLPNDYIKMVRVLDDHSSKEIQKVQAMLLKLN